jgi:hypothetical protein
MAKFALRFCKPIHFGVPPVPERTSIVNGPTASLLKIRGDFLIVTCSHVIDRYRVELAEDSRCLFAVANCYLDPFASARR